MNPESRRTTLTTRHGGGEMRLIDTDIEEVDRRYGDRETFEWEPFLPSEAGELTEVDEAPIEGQHDDSEQESQNS
jgi:hypothetical protein